MNLQENISRIKQLMVEDTSKHETEVKQIVIDIETLLNLYVKGDDGKYYDKKKYKEHQQDPNIELEEVNLEPVIGFFKNKIESVRFDAMQKNEFNNNFILIANYNKFRIIIEDFFEKDYNEFTIPTMKIDYFTNKKCSEMDPKSPSCGGPLQN